MATIKDIAREAGVSFTTVSNVIHGKTNKVSPAMVNKIKKIMEEMNYVPNMGARMLVQSCSRIIGVIANDLTKLRRDGAQSPFMAEILGTMEKEIRRNGYYMMLCFSDSVSEIENLLSTWNVDGIIAVSLGTEVSRKLAEQISVPAVFIDCYFGKDEKYLNVGTADEQGAYEITSYLVRMGHRKLLFLSDIDIKTHPEDQWNVGRMRELGYLRALKDAGINCDESWILSCPYQRQAREALFEEIIKRKGTVTGLVFCNDYFAIEAMDYLSHRGIRIPEDFSVTGFDDIDMARLSSPRLTTIQQGVSQKGQIAVEKLICAIEKEPIEERNTRLPVRLIIRESAQRIEKKV